MNDRDIAMLGLTASVVAAYVSNVGVRAGDIPGLIKGVHGALSGIGAQQAIDETVKVDFPTAAEVRRSITPSALISFIDGKPYKTLKRHLSTRGMTIDGYKARFGLPRDYPTTAPAYSEARSKLAMAIGLGRGGRKAKRGS